MTTTDNTTRAIDIFEILKRIDLKDRNFYSNLDDAQKKAFVPVVIMQWLVCCDNDLQRLLVNEYVNKYVFKLYKHPEILYQLMICCSSGKPKFYKWNKVLRKSSKFPKSIELLKKHLSISTKRAEQDLQLIPNEQLIMLACEMGYQKDELKDLQTELKQRL